jgi:hypothetical protein
MEGWIKTYRELENHWIWNNDKYLKCWLWFLFRANHCKNKILIGAEFIEIERGEFITSISKIGLASGMSLQSTRTFLALLEKDKMINKQTTSKLTKITICNYEYYQNGQQTKNKPTNKHVTQSQQGDNTIVTTDKNEKNDIKNEKNEKKGFIPPTLEDVISYFKENGYSEESARKVFKYYSTLDWHDSKGNKIRNWKSKMIAVWFKDENRIKQIITGEDSVQRMQRELKELHEREKQNGNK